MQITSRFTIAVHIITAVDYFKDSEIITSAFLAGSVGTNPVTIRSVMSQLKNAGILTSSQGRSGIYVARPLADISFYDIYVAVECLDESGLFHFHENPNIDCPVGRNIHGAMDSRLRAVQDTMEGQLKEISIADVVNDVRRRILETE